MYGCYSSTLGVFSWFFFWDSLSFDAPASNSSMLDGRCMLTCWAFLHRALGMSFGFSWRHDKHLWNEPSPQTWEIQLFRRKEHYKLGTYFSKFAWPLRPNAPGQKGSGEQSQGLKQQTPFPQGREWFPMFRGVYSHAIFPSFLLLIQLPPYAIKEISLTARPSFWCKSISRKGTLLQGTHKTKQQTVKQNTTHATHSHLWLAGHFSGRSICTVIRAKWCQPN